MARRLRSVVTLAAAGLLAGAAVSSGCSETPTSTQVRSLSSSGPVSFVCLGSPDAPLDEMALPLSACRGGVVQSLDDYSIPHLYAMVTQTVRGEVAVVDLTTSGNAIVNQDKSVPSHSFLPVGAQPTDIVSTPAGMATFVGSAEPRFEGIYALPSSRVRNARARLTSWPACRLPSAPGAMTIAVDPVDDSGNERPSCDAGYGDADADDSCCTDADIIADGADCTPSTHCHGDLSGDAETAGTPGRYKLLVTLPAEGGIAVIDAQDILDQDAGMFAPCTIDRWLPLEVELPPPGPAPTPPDPNAVCVEPPAVTAPFAESYTPRPASITHDGDRLYIADKAAPVIHRVDVPTPCEPREIAPLYATSTEDPSRVVTTSRVAVSPPTLDLKRYLYAIDDIDGSIMVYDVSDNSTDQRPLERAGAATNPFQPTDRLRFVQPPKDIIIVQHQYDTTDPQTGATIPVRCDPDPDSSGPGSQYRTTEGYDNGAGPGRLRGVFAFALLVSGEIVVIDIDDYDAACRGPRNQHPLFGCSGSDSGLETSGEYSCNTFEPHAPRSTRFLLNQQGLSTGEPGLETLPVLFDESGSLLKLDRDVKSPRLIATLPTSPLPAGVPFELQVGNDGQTINAESGLIRTNDKDNPFEHTLAMNLVDPRAHAIDQEWRVTFEGGIPGFGDRFASIVELGSGRFQLRESTVGFCSRGVTPQNALAAELESDGLTPSQAAQAAAPFADYVELLADPPVETDSHWENLSGECSAVTYSACDTHFGSSATPRENRHLRIIEATEDTLEVEHRIRQSGEAPPLKCCFPGVVEFRVRAGNQWVVDGELMGFLHHGDVNEAGYCRPSCDPNLQLLAGRVREARDEDGNLLAQIEQGEDGCTNTFPAVADDHPDAFRNPFFRFAIHAGTRYRRRPCATDECERDEDCGEPVNPNDPPPIMCVEGVCEPPGGFPCNTPPRCELADVERPYVPQLSKTQRDTQFKFTTRGHFSPLLLSMVSDEAAVIPTAATFLAPTNELVISDGQLTGITFIDLNVLAITRQYK